MADRMQVDVYRRSASRYDGMHGDQLVVIALTAGKGWWAVEHVRTGKTADVYQPHGPDPQDRDAAATRAIQRFLSR